MSTYPKKPVAQLPANVQLANTGSLNQLALTPPPSRPEPQIVGEGADAVAELVRRLREEAKVL